MGLRWLVPAAVVPWLLAACAGLRPGSAPFVEPDPGRSPREGDGALAGRFLLHKPGSGTEPLAGREVVLWPASDYSRVNARDQPAISVAMKASSQPAYLRLPLRLAFSEPSARARLIAILRSRARFRAALRSRTRLASSRKVTSKTQCSPFSIPRWRRMAAASVSGGSAALDR